ncbi:MAG TPA: GNAT family N-acetyltransferase [Chlamydiales bacterium]|nr:GNAT family N-acetyltransferase [Chlamydiales bacterium]
MSKKPSMRLLLISLCLFCFTSLSAYDYSILRGEEFYALYDELATLTINVFREYPYLYDGNLESEKECLSHYFSTKNSALVVVKDKERIIGAITGIPLNETFFDCKNCFVENNLPMEEIFYLGEITLLKEYRGQGIGARMYALFEEFVRENKIYKEIAFCEVVPPKNDPRCPSDYFCLDRFWTKRGYIKNPDWVTQFSWKELSSQEKFYHPMVFWSKKL